MKSKILTKPSKFILAASALSLATTPAFAQGDGEVEQWNELLRGAICVFIGSRASARDVRHHARERGYRNVQDIEFVNRSHPRVGGCGFYQAVAEREGHTYVLVADASDGRIVGRRPLHVRTEGEAQLSKAEVRRQLWHQGYRDIRAITYVRRDDNDFYRARARHRGMDYRLRVSDETGEVLNRRAAGGGRDHPNRRAMTPREIRQALRENGYYRIHDIRYLRRRGNDFYVASAWRDDDGLYRLRVNDADGEIQSRRLQRAASTTEPELNETRMRRILARRGYEVRRLRYRQRDATDFYVALAIKDDTRYRLRISDETAEFLARREVRREYRRDLNDRAEMDEAQIRRALRRQGYGPIRDLRYVSRSEGDWYVARARKEGVWYRLIVDDENGEVVRRRELRRHEAD